MDIDTQYRHSTNGGIPSDDHSEKVHQKGEKLACHDSWVANNDFEGEHVDVEKVSVMQGKKKKTSVPVWRLVRASHCHCNKIINTRANN